MQAARLEEAVHCGELQEDHLLQLGGGQAELRPQPHPRPQQGRQPRLLLCFCHARLSDPVPHS